MNTDGLFAFERVAAPANYIPALRKIADRYVAGEFGESDAVVKLMDWFDAHGLKVNKDGGIDDWTSTAHMHSVLTDYFYMRGGERDVAMDAQNPESVDMYPARRLTVWYENEMDKDRDWGERWVAACRQVNWVGCARTEAMALKSSPVWRALGNGAGGYEDWLGNPFPPFAFSSGIHWEEVSRKEAIAAGLRPKPKTKMSFERRADIFRVKKKLGPEVMASLQKMFAELDREDAEAAARGE